MSSLRKKRTLRACLLGLAVVGFASQAFARTELLRWSHPSPSSVAGFKVYVGNASGSYQSTVDVGMPTPSSGVYTYSLTVPDANSVFVAVSAYGPTGLEGAKSNEQSRPGLIGAPGKPQIQP